MFKLVRIDSGAEDIFPLGLENTAEFECQIFGFSFLEQNRDRIQGSAIDGVIPEFDSISGGAYPILRSMYFYVKSAHAGVIPGIEEFIAAFMDEESSGTYGYLTDKGLIPLDDEEREAVLESALAMEPLELP